MWVLLCLYTALTNSATVWSHSYGWEVNFSRSISPFFFNKLNALQGYSFLSTCPYQWNLLLITNSSLLAFVSTFCRRSTFSKMSLELLLIWTLSLGCTRVTKHVLQTKCAWLKENSFSWLGLCNTDEPSTDTV